MTTPPSNSAALAAANQEGKRRVCRHPPSMRRSPLAGPNRFPDEVAEWGGRCRAVRVSQPRLGRDHDVMVNAIAARNADEAEQAAHEHTMLFQRRFLAYMQQNLTKAVSVK